MAKMTVYHGGYEPVKNPEIRIGRNTKDFGAGFYCTIIKEQAERWARRYSSKIVSVYDVRMDSSLNIKEFKEMSEDWLDFIVTCRHGESHDYDIVIGAMADEMQSCGIGKLLLDYIKDKKVSLRLNVYQKNARAISFYQREGFIIQCEGLDEATGEKEYTMLWKQK